MLQPINQHLLAQDAINNLFGDTTVPRSTTIQRLEELEADIQIKLEALREEENANPFVDDGDDA